MTDRADRATDPRADDATRAAMRRRRARFAVLAVATMATGLAVHHAPRDAIGPAARDVAGDALWATMLAWWIGALVPRVGAGARAVGTYAACVAVETSQRLHTPALDALRATTLGRLVLGSGFDARDLVAYAVGVLAAWSLERAWRRHGGAHADARGT